MSTKPKTYNAVGTRPIRHDGLDKVTGRANYGADISLPGLLHGAILRSPHAHARILSIDTREAGAVPGVKAVITGRDIPETDAKWLLTEGKITPEEKDVLLEFLKVRRKEDKFWGM